MRITILEGARGTGKSTLAFKLRQMNPNTTLVNCTGFHEDGEAGLQKVGDYYDSWMHFLMAMSTHDSNMVFDRFYFTERIFSDLYKSYDFTDRYNRFNDLLEDLSHFGVEINIIFLTVSDEDEVKHRLNREKIPFGKAEESAEESLKQQAIYSRIFRHIHYNYGNDNLKVHTVDTSFKTNQDVYVEVLKIFKPLS